MFFIVGEEDMEDKEILEKKQRYRGNIKEKYKVHENLLIAKQARKTLRYIEL